MVRLSGNLRKRELADRTLRTGWPPEFARRSGIPVYVVRIDAEQESSDVKTPTRGLAGLARGTGGRMYVIGGAGQLGEIYGVIGEELHNQYVLSYHPESASGGERWREITLKAKRPGVTIRTISGYYARP